MRWIWFAALLILLIGALVFTQTHPVDAPVGPNALLYFAADTQRELTRLPMHYTRIPDADEIKIGNGIAERYGRPQQDEESRTIEAYLQTVGNRVAAHAYRKLPYKFHYIPDRYFINAFALPGGHVYMGAGLLNLMESEDELASVLGHEIEHIDHYHCAERLQLERAMRKVPLLRLASLPIEIFQMGYTKDQELEADREGTQLAVAAGYSPEGAVKVFAEFQKMEEQIYGRRKAQTPEEEISGAAIQILTGYFQSHPPSGDRIAKIRDLIVEKKWTVGPSTPLEVRYIFLAHQADDLVAAAKNEQAAAPAKSKYEKAAELAASALKMHARYPLALAALAKAKCALRDFSAASAAYKELLPADPAGADTVRAFADDLGAKAMAAKHLAEAGQFAAFSLELQPDNPSSLRLLAQVKLEQGEMDAALETGRKLLKLYPQTGSQLVQYSTEAAEKAYVAHDYERSVRFATYAVQLEPSPRPATRLQLARSEFALGHFAGAAASYRALLEYYIREKETIDPVILHAYADALGSLPGHAAAAQEFQGVFRPVRPVTWEGDTFLAQAKVEEAGLLLMAGDASLARQLSERPFTAGAQAFAPEFMARLGWWYYRAGQYDAADKLIRRFLTLRPGDKGLQSALGWLAIERNAPAESLRLFEYIPVEDEPWRSVRAGCLIAQWRLRQTDSAVAGFEQLEKASPQWKNPAWIKAFYGLVAVQSLEEMRAEEDRRIAARRAH